MTDIIKCPQCGADQFFLLKRRYNAGFAFNIFCAVTSILALFWYLIISGERTDKHYENNFLLWAVTALILLLSVLSGFADASKNRNVCTKCGHITELKK